MAEAHFQSRVSDEDSERSYRIVDGEFNPLEDGLQSAGAGQYSHLVTLDGNTGH